MADGDPPSVEVDVLPLRRRDAAMFRESSSITCSEKPANNQPSCHDILPRFSGVYSDGVWHVAGHCSPSVDRLVGLGVKASASRAEDPGFESRSRRDFSGVESYQ